MDDAAFLLWLVTFCLGIIICVNVDIFIFALLMEALCVALIQIARTIIVLFLLCILIIVFCCLEKQKRSLQEKRPENHNIVS